MKSKGHRIEQVFAGSIAEELGIEAGDILLAVNQTQIEDIFDYQYLMEDEYVEILIQKESGEEWLLEVEKDMGEDIGVSFENGLMSEYRSCHNKCMFCFIDQMPKGMRETLYFKDDDSRLSFLQGNYVTLTNMGDRELARIIHYHLGPINVSVHTTNPELRCKMLHNRFAGDILDKLRTLYDGGIELNGQIVLCKGVNDGVQLAHTIEDLMQFLPLMKSLSVVPAGLTKYRKGLYPLEVFQCEEAKEVLELIEHYQQICYERYGTHFVHASDEWYILAGREFPEEERYDGYVQLENGVGMMRLLENEFQTELQALKESADQCQKYRGQNHTLSIATGLLAYPMICRLASEVMTEFPGIQVEVYPITNYFFGESITVSGLITGTDLRKQLTDKTLGERLLLPANMLRMGEEVFLDDVTIKELENALQVPINIVESSGKAFLYSLLEVQQNTRRKNEKFVYIQAYDRNQEEQNE